MNISIFSDIDKFIEKRNELSILEESIINNCLLNLLSNVDGEINVNSYNLYLASISPNYFNSKEQIFIVVSILEEINKIEIIKEYLENFIKEKEVIFNNKIIKLNDIVIKVLKEEIEKLRDV